MVYCASMHVKKTISFVTSIMNCFFLSFNSHVKRQAGKNLSNHYLDIRTWKDLIQSQIVPHWNVIFKKIKIAASDRPKKFNFSPSNYRHTVVKITYDVIFIKLVVPSWVWILNWKYQNNNPSLTMSKILLFYSPKSLTDKFENTNFSQEQF